MAGFLTDFAEQKILEHMFGKTAWTMPTIYLGPSTTTPNKAGGNITEPVGNNYARITTSAASWGTASQANPSTIQNAAVLTSNTASGSWGSYIYMVAFDALTSGNALYVFQLTSSKSVGSGQAISIPIGGLVWNLGADDDF
jgi:hypothetical protein